MRLRMLAVPIAVLLLGGTAAALGLNLGFESGDLSGWESEVPPSDVAGYAGFVAAVTVDYGLVTTEGSTEVPVLPVEGDYYALLQTGLGDAPTRLWRTFDAAAGDTISGYARFLTSDYWPMNDHAEVWVRAGGADGAVVAVLFEESVATVDGWGSTDWIWFEHTFQTAGTYVLEARVTNDYDPIQDSWLCLDDVALPGSSGLPMPSSSEDVPVGLDIPLSIDVKPGSDVNPIKLSSKGKLPVAILGTEAFDVADLDPSTLRLGPGAAAPAHEDGHLEDVDGDGIVDLVVHFPVSDLGLSEDDETIDLEGLTWDGTTCRGSDAVHVK